MLKFQLLLRQKLKKQFDSDFDSKYQNYDRRPENMEFYLSNSFVALLERYFDNFDKYLIKNIPALTLEKLTSLDHLQSAQNREPEYRYNMTHILIYRSCSNIEVTLCHRLLNRE